MKKQYIFFVVLFVLIGTVITLSIYKYNQQPKGVTISQALHQRDTALLDLKTQKLLTANDELAIANLTADKRALTDQKNALCAQIKAAKMLQPICQ